MDSMPGAIPTPRRQKKSERRQCRICLAGSEEAHELGKLIKPCLCKGSIRYVHVQCLNQWRMSAVSQQAYWACPQCGFRYSLVRKTALNFVTSKVVLGFVTLILFSIVVFASSFVVSWLLPELDPSSPSSFEDSPAASTSQWFTSPDTGFQRSSWGFYYISPYTATKELIKFAMEAFVDTEEELEDFWSSRTGRERRQDPDSPTVIQLEDARDGIRTGAFKSTVRATTFNNRERARRRESPSLLRVIFHRYILGLSLVGIVSFMNLLISTSLLGPLNMARGTWVRNTRREGRGTDMGTIIIATFVVIGVARAMYQAYKFTQALSKRLMARMETAIVEVGEREDDDTEDEEQDKFAGSDEEKTDTIDPASNISDNGSELGAAASQAEEWDCLQAEETTRGLTPEDPTQEGLRQRVTK